MKFLIRQSVKGPYINQAIHGSNVDGFNVADVPDYIQNFEPGDSSIPTFITRKYDAIGRLYPNLSHRATEEFLSFAGVAAGPTSSSYIIGPEKKPILLPGGVIFVGAPYTMNVLPSSIFTRYMAYSENLNTDGFGLVRKSLDTNFNQSDLQMDITNTAGVVQQTMNLDQEIAPDVGISGQVFPFNFLVKLTNTSPRNLTISDFCVFWGLRVV